jgi:regulator of protease activity HflC (stomatin/prohibitin superfamily)
MIFILALLVAVVGFVLWSWLRKRVIRSTGNTHDLEIKRNIYDTAVIGTGSLAGVALLVALSQCITQIPAGHVGVIDFFGRVSERTLRSGVNLVNPMARVIKMSVQTKEMREQMQVLSKEGLSIALEISVLYKLDADAAANVYKTIAGGNFEEIILVPQFRSISRAATASFQASALYSLEREQLAIQIQQELAKVVGSRGVAIEATPLRGVGLPPQLTDAIEQKQKADQESQRMEFILTKEKQEAERKRIEAQGIADFQRIVAAGISEQLLRWKGIEATLKIAESSNSKVVVIGSGKDGLPIILGSQ